MGSITQGVLGGMAITQRAQEVAAQMQLERERLAMYQKNQDRLALLQNLDALKTAGELPPGPTQQRVVDQILLGLGVPEEDRKALVKEKADSYATMGELVGQLVAANPGMGAKALQFAFKSGGLTVKDLFLQAQKLQQERAYAEAFPDRQAGVDVYFQPTSPTAGAPITAPPTPTGPATFAPLGVRPPANPDEALNVVQRQLDDLDQSVARLLRGGLMNADVEKGVKLRQDYLRKQQEDLTQRLYPEGETADVPIDGRMHVVILDKKDRTKILKDYGPKPETYDIREAAGPTGAPAIVAFGKETLTPRVIGRPAPPTQAPLDIQRYWALRKQYPVGTPERRELEGIIKEKTAGAGGEKAAQLATQFASQSRTFQEVSDHYSNMINAVPPGAQPTPASSVTILYGWFKMMNPTSRMTLDTFSDIGSVESIPDQIKSQWKKAVQGGVLDEKFRQDILQQGRRIYEGQRRQHEARVKHFTQAAEASGVDPNLVIAPFGVVAPATVPGAGGGPPSDPVRAAARKRLGLD